MFIPIRDDNPSLLTPYVTVGLISVNVLVYLYQMTLPPPAMESWFFSMGVVPGNIYTGNIFTSVLPFITSLFVHGGILHLGGNMLYLWIFGDNIESSLGHGRFLFFYLVCGFVATLVQVMVNYHPGVPIIGASGAISGILGAYLIRFPLARIHVLVILIFFITRIHVPAYIVLGFWFLIQFSNALSSLGIEGGGVAWFAHVGGFIAGVLMLLYFMKKSKFQQRKVWID